MTRLKFIRIARGLTQSQVAALAAIDQATVCQIESGRLKPLPHHLARIAKALNVSADTLLDEIREEAVAS